MGHEVRDTDKDWTEIAEEEPYWGVLSVNDYRGAELSKDARANFFYSGQVLIDNTIAFTRAHLLNDFAPERALDFGCGVGRLLIPIAGYAKEAIGLDIAPRMRELTEHNLKLAGVTNAAVRASDDDLSQAEGTFDFVNSYIVIQHIPPVRGMPILERLIRKIKIGGVGSFQLTYAKERRFFLHEAGRARFYRREGDSVRDIIPEPGPQGPHITMFDYDLNAVMALVATYGGSTVMVLPTNDDGHLGVHLLFRKAR